MSKSITLVVAVFLLGIAITACAQDRTETTHVSMDGRYKILIISQEALRSGIRNIDACVLKSSETGIRSSDRKLQCFLHGYDFSDLTIKWKSASSILVRFRSGRISQFKNYAVVPDQTNPVEFHIFLDDGGD